MAKSIRKSPKHEYDILAASVEGVASRWREQYPEGQRQLAGGKSAKEIQDGLDALCPDADPNKAAEIIGNKSWTHPHCKCCNKYVERAISFGEYDSVSVCLPCLELTAEALRKSA